MWYPQMQLIASQRVEDRFVVVIDQVDLHEEDQNMHHSLRN